MLSFNQRKKFLLQQFRKARIMKTIGASLHIPKPGRAAIRWRFHPRFNQNYGVVHGGLIGALADSAGYMASASLLEEGLVTTAEYKMQLLEPAFREDLTAEAVVIRKGKRLLVTEMRVYGKRRPFAELRDEGSPRGTRRKLVGIALGTYLNYHPKHDQSPV